MKTMKIILVFVMVFVASGILLAQKGDSTATVQTNEKTVMVCDSPKAAVYHSGQCRGLNRCKHKIINITVTEAEKKGLRPCKICYK